MFGLSDVAREPGADTTPFPNAGFDCPGDDDLVNVRSSAQLVTDLVSTFAIVERRLDTWTLPMLEELIPHPEWPDREPETRGWTLQRCFAHDVSHMTELNETLARAGLAQVDLWS